MMKIKRLKPLSEFGFDETPHGWAKEIPQTFRHKYTLYIGDDDIYGTVTGLMSGGGDTMDFEPWFDRMKFRSPEAAEGVKKLISELAAAGAICIEAGH